MALSLARFRRNSPLPKSLLPTSAAGSTQPRHRAHPLDRIPIARITRPTPPHTDQEIGFPLILSSAQISTPKFNNHTTLTHVCGCRESGSLFIFPCLAHSPWCCLPSPYSRRPAQFYLHLHPVHSLHSVLALRFSSAPRRTNSLAPKLPFLARNCGDGRRRNNHVPYRSPDRPPPGLNSPSVSIGVFPGKIPRFQTSEVRQKLALLKNQCKKTFRSHSHIKSNPNKHFQFFQCSP